MFKMDDVMTEDARVTQASRPHIDPLISKKDWIEQPIVLAPTKLKPAAPSCWYHFRGKAYCMPWVK